MGATQKAQASGLAEVTSGLAGLHTTYYGQGPTTACTYMVDDMLVCFLEGGFTTVEQTLIRDGNSEAVHRIRRSFQTTMEQPFRGVVEKAIGRKVLAYMSQTHTQPDLAVELFVLEPSAEPMAAGHREEIAQAAGDAGASGAGASGDE